MVTLFESGLLDQKCEYSPTINCLLLLAGELKFNFVAMLRMLIFIDFISNGFTPCAADHAHFGLGNTFKSIS